MGFGKAEVSEYEAIRRRNIEENRRILRELGLLNPFRELVPVQKTESPKGKKRRSATPADCQKPKKKALLTSTIDERGILLPVDENDGKGRRKSARLQGKVATAGTELEQQARLELEEEEKENPRIIIPKDRQNVFGAIPGIEVGKFWMTRLHCCADGVHRPTVAGIHGGVEGAYSVALSGGYEDDIDLGDCFTYTGEGGRDLKGTKSNPKNLRTAPQSKDQTLTRGNLALKNSAEKRLPVRVIRGYKLRSLYAPEEGYRYDGLYYVDKYWLSLGLSGFMVYKFALRRCENQAPLPWPVSVPSPVSPPSTECQESESPASPLKTSESPVSTTDAETKPVAHAEDTERTVDEGKL